MSYFCWSEILKLSARFTNLAEDKDLRDLLAAPERISRLWASDGYPDKMMRVFTGEQRAIAELLFRGDVETPICAGYLAFLEDFATTDNPPPIITALSDDIIMLATDPTPAIARLKDIQNGLIDPLSIIDPDFVRFPKEQRAKV